MSFRVADLWRWDGTIDRGPYLLIGLTGFALKHNLDRFLASSFAPSKEPQVAQGP